MDAGSVREWSNIIMDALRNPVVPRPKGEPVIGEITRSYVSCAFSGQTLAKRIIILQASGSMQLRP